MADALERLKAYVVPPEECLAMLAMAKSVVANAGKPQAQAEAAKPAAPVIETDPKLGATLDQFRDQEKFQVQAEAIRDTFGGFALAGCLSKIYEGRVDGGGFLAYVAAALEQARATEDPLERMLVEQVVWAHHRIGVLQMAAAAEKNNADTIAILTAAAARLMKEVRQAVLALQQYRTPTAKVSIAVEQPMAAEPAAVNGHTVTLPPEKTPRTEQVAKMNGNGKCPKNRLSMYLQPDLDVSGVMS
jgi:hypothetical protein